MLSIKTCLYFFLFGMELIPFQTTKFRFVQSQVFADDNVNVTRELKLSYQGVKQLEKVVNSGTSIFSFSQNVFCPFRNKFQFVSHIYFIIADASNLGQSKILTSGYQHFLLFPDFCTCKVKYHRLLILVIQFVNCRFFFILHISRFQYFKYRQCNRKGDYQF